MIDLAILLIRASSLVIGLGVSTFVFGLLLWVVLTWRGL